MKQKIETEDEDGSKTITTTEKTLDDVKAEKKYEFKINIIWGIVCFWLLVVTYFIFKMWLCNCQ